MPIIQNQLKPMYRNNPVAELWSVLLLMAGAFGAAGQGDRPTGTAFLVNPNGYLLTCAHVVKDAANVEVAVGDKTYEATVLNVDEKRDLALLKIKVMGLVALPLANSSAVEVGQEVRAFGFPLSSVLGGTVKVTGGRISGIETKDAIRVFQIDAAVNPGNSGGPLVNEKGEVIGIVNAKLVGAAVSSVGFSVPVNYAKPLLRDEEVEFQSKGTSEKLDAVALVKLVTPAVALVTVTTKASDFAAPEASSELLWTLTGHTQEVYSVAFSPDGKVVASASRDSTVRLWDVQSGKVKRTLNQPFANAVAFSPDGKIVASGGSGTVRFWNAETGATLQTIRVKNSSMDFSPDGKTLATVDEEGNMKVWEVQTGELKQSFATDKQNAIKRSLKFSRDGKIIASTGGFDDKANLWEARTGNLIRTLAAQSRESSSIAVSPDGKMVAFLRAANGLSVAVCDIQTGNLLRDLSVEDVKFPQSALAFSPDGKVVAATGNDGVGEVIFLLDAQTGKLRRTLAGHSSVIDSMAFSPDGKILASSSQDMTVKLWNVGAVKK